MEKDAEEEDEAGRKEMRKASEEVNDQTKGGHARRRR